ncbi:hypothetical protein ABPG74_020429 [Tetrahymena malaccensis]
MLTIQMGLWIEIEKQDIIEIEGIFSSEHFKHAKIGITDCKNNTPESNPWRPVCASPQFIKSYFDTNKNVRVVMQVVNYIINPPDPSNYITSFLDNQLFFTVNPQSYQTADIYFNEYEFITDNSIMPYKSIESKKLPVLENGNFRAQQFLYTQTSYGDFFFRRDPVTYTLNRQFQKVSEVISYIGGFSQIFLSIAAVIGNQIQIQNTLFYQFFKKIMQYAFIMITFILLNWLISYITSSQKILRFKIKIQQDNNV